MNDSSKYIQILLSGIFHLSNLFATSIIEEFIYSAWVWKLPQAIRFLSSSDKFSVGLDCLNRKIRDISYLFHCVILPEDQILLKFDTLRLPYNDRICQRQCLCTK